ncbi:hypothetical protein MCOR19_001326 [Pyricularia oryzae]|nr:hypothetical protein MCOR19_001326 [Pyricularia oryzae]
MSWMFRMYKFADSERANSEKSQFFKVGWAKVMDDSGPGAHDRRGREEHRRLDLWYLGSSTGTCPDWKPPMTPMTEITKTKQAQEESLFTESTQAQGSANNPRTHRCG